MGERERGSGEIYCIRATQTFKVFTRKFCTSRLPSNCFLFLTGVQNNSKRFPACFLCVIFIFSDFSISVLQYKKTSTEARNNIFICLLLLSPFYLLSAFPFFRRELSPLVGVCVCKSRRWRLCWCDECTRKFFSFFHFPSITMKISILITIDGFPSLSRDRFPTRHPLSAAIWSSKKALKRIVRARVEISSLSNEKNELLVNGTSWLAKQLQAIDILLLPSLSRFVICFCLSQTMRKLKRWVKQKKLFLLIGWQNATLK